MSDMKANYVSSAVLAAVVAYLYVRLAMLVRHDGSVSLSLLATHDGLSYPDVPYG